jgi:hypothetical protein
LLGATHATHGQSSISQTFTAPSNATYLSFWYANHCPDNVQQAWAGATLRDNTKATVTNVLPRVCAAHYVWTLVTAPVVAGHSYTLALWNSDDNDAADATYTLYDDVTLNNDQYADFSISAASFSAWSGQPNSTTVVTKVTRGTAAPVSFTVFGVPSGATASFAPSRVTAGGDSTLTIDTGTAAVGTYVLSITGTEGTRSHSVSVSFGIDAGGVVNGGFETGTLYAWTTSGASSSAVASPHSGTYAALVGATTATNGDSLIYQTFTAPLGTSTLSLWYANSCPDSVQYDWAAVTLRDNTTGVVTTVLPAALGIGVRQRPLRALGQGSDRRQRCAKGHGDSRAAVDGPPVGVQEGT